jgi:ApbE superfamily uncharacterized protein (UPF0280 family)
MPELREDLSVQGLHGPLLIGPRPCTGYRLYLEFRWKGARYRIGSPLPDAVVSEIKRQRGILEEYIRDHPDYAASLVPVETAADAPEIVRWMAEQAAAVGVGPMASVAGAIAEKAARAALRRGASYAIVENGGDIFLDCRDPVRVGLYAGKNSVSGRLALRIEPQHMPVAVCSSSSRMGHSLSLGDCDLATVVAADAALADAAATKACNLVMEESDISDTLDAIVSVSGVRGLLIVKNDKIGMAGDLPELVPTRAADTEGDI